MYLMYSVVLCFPNILLFPFIQFNLGIVLQSKFWVKEKFKNLTRHLLNKNDKEQFQGLGRVVCSWLKLVQWGSKSKIVGYSDHGDLFDHGMVCFSDIISRSVDLLSTIL